MSSDQSWNIVSFVFDDDYILLGMLLNATKSRYTKQYLNATFQFIVTRYPSFFDKTNHHCNYLCKMSWRSNKYFLHQWLNTFFWQLWSGDRRNLLFELLDVIKTTKIVNMWCCHHSSRTLIIWALYNVYIMVLWLRQYAEVYCGQ